LDGWIYKLSVIPPQLATLVCRGNDIIFDGFLRGEIDDRCPTITDHVDDNRREAQSIGIA
jgi:hypothetical protein